LLFPDRAPPPGADRGAPAALTFADGTRGDVLIDRYSAGEGPLRLSAIGDAALLDQLARSSAVKLVHRGETIAEVPLPQIESAIAVLRRCADSLLAEWGVDTAAQAALQRKVERIPGVVSWISNDDYPRGAARRGSSGETIVRLTVDEVGRVRDCTVAATSGDADLDGTACRIFTERGRYVPALDAGGRPTTAAKIEVVKWRLPQ
jgi:TonB family protein